MEVHLSPEQEAHLSQIANHNGTLPEQLVKDATVRLLEEDSAICAGIQRGIDQADRGDLIDHDEVVARFERSLRPK